jgi:hypothetical protein
MAYIEHLINKYNIESGTNDEGKNKLDMEKILSVLDDDKHEDIISLTRSKIKILNNKILQQLGISGYKLKELHKKLRDYRYVSDLVNLKEGSYIRWIPLKNILNDNSTHNIDNMIKLTNGGFVIAIKIFETGLQILCKNTFNRVFQLVFDDVIIFQKLTNQETLLIDIIEYLHK